MDWNKILQVKNVTKNYGKGESRTAALRGISFDVLEGEFLGIMGDSGSGKTTLLNCIATMTRPTSGEILLNGEDISASREPGLQNTGEERSAICIRNLNFWIT